jgi:serine/threonine protein kinase
MSGNTERLNTALAGRYKIEKQLGQGGMATVYLAKDIKHDRMVAVKVLKPELAAVLGAERFVVEIKTTAALQHPHILPLFDSGTTVGHPERGEGSFLYYVMPYIEGETLRDKLNRETQFSVDEAVRITTQVADALDYAHRHGVIHRDIKPENILLHDGRPMVADFGIALAVSAAAGGRMTETGLSLGTPHYMSPEQATAEKEITGRSDIYSLASVMYEMLAGAPPHMGASAQQIIMKIITEHAAPVTNLRKAVPPNVAAALEKALEKLPADRFETAKAFGEALVNRTYTSATFAGTAGPLHASRFTLHGLVAALSVAAIAIIAAVWGWARSAPPSPVIRHVFAPPAMFSQGELPVPTPSPDGSFIVFHGPTPGSTTGQQLWIKRRDHVAATPIAGSLDAHSFALSPDGVSIAFISGSLLKKIPVAGGTPVTLTVNAIEGLGVAWAENGSIVFSRLTRNVPELAQVPASGGRPTAIWSDRAFGGVFPNAIWGTNAVMFSKCNLAIVCDLMVADLTSKAAHVLLPGVSWAQHSTTGHIVFLQSGRLMAVAFDGNRLAVRGDPVALADSVGGLYPLHLSRSGTLVTRIGGSTTVGTPFDMVWVDRAGRMSPVDSTWQFRVTESANNHGWSLSPDGTRLAIGLHTDAGDDIWIKQLPHGPLSRVSYDPAPEARPRWTRDGTSAAFLGGSGDATGVLQRRADATGKDSMILTGVIDEIAFSPDGSWLVYRDGAAGSISGGRDIKGVRRGDTTRVPLIVTTYDEEAMAISPDGKWIAYQSDETGRTEVFIRSFPSTDAFKRQVSNGGGEAPLWSRDGRELFFVGVGKDMMSARVTAAAPPLANVAQPTRLFHVPDELLAVEYSYYTPWDVALDGRFIMARVRRTESVPSTVVIAENWFTELTARVRK